MSTMMTKIATIDEKIAEMRCDIAKLTKTVEEKDLQIATFMNKLEVHKQGESKLAMANLKLISIYRKGLINVFQRRLTTNKGAPPSSLLYHSNNCKMIVNTIQSQYGGAR